MNSQFYKYADKHAMMSVATLVDMPHYKKCSFIIANQLLLVYVYEVLMGLGAWPASTIMLITIFVMCAQKLFLSA